MRRRSVPEIAAATIEKYEMLGAGEKIVIAVSGGPDSTALLLFLADLAEEHALHLSVWHLDHLMRAEAKAEAEHVRALASRFKLDCYVEEFDVKGFARENRFSVQEAGRIIRYEKLRNLCARIGADKLAVGHNADDNAETVLINLTRGTGLAGLSGIPPIDGALIRPLIECERVAIENYLREKDEDFNVDPSNQDKRYLRNRIRHAVLPELKAINPALVKNMINMTALLREEERLISESVDTAVQALLRLDGGEVRISRDSLRSLAPALGRRVIRRALARVAGSDERPDYKNISAVFGEALTSGRRLELSRGLRVEFDSSEMIVYLEKTPFAPFCIGERGGRFVIDDGRLSVTIAPVKEVELPLGQGRVAADADLIEWPLTVRPWMAGDWFIPSGMTGRKKLSDFFIDEKISKRRRRRLPIFADKSKIVAVGDLRIDQRVILSDMTKRVAVIKSGGL